MKIEDKLKTIKDEIPKSPTYMKQKVMDLIKSPSKLHNKGIKLNLYKLIPLLSISVLIVVLIVVGITNKDTLLPNNNQDNEVSKLIYESDINDYLFYQVTIENNNKYNYNDEINLLVEYGYKDINNKPFDNLLITLEAVGFVVLGEESYLITDINDNNLVTFKLKLNDNNTTNGNISINFRSIASGDYNEELDESFNAKLQINYNSNSKGIEFKRG